MRSSLLQSGVSIIQGMVVSAVLAGSALIATRMITTQKMAVKSAETKDHVMQLHKLIFADLQNREHCLMTLTPVITGANPLTPGTAKPFAVSTIMAKVENSVTGLARFTVNSGAAYDPTTIYMNGNVRINSMTLNTTTNLGDPQPLVINYRRIEGKKNASRTKVGFGGSSISKTIWIRLQRATSASTTINGCYAVEIATEGIEGVSQATCNTLGSAYYWDTLDLKCKLAGKGNEDLNKEFCTNLGQGGSLYYWDSTRNACVLKNNICGVREVFEGIDSTGSAICRSINDYLPFLIQPGSNPCSGTKTSVTLFRDPGTNKVSIVCSSTAVGDCPSGQSGYCHYRRRQCSPVLNLDDYWSASNTDAECQSMNPGLSCMADNELTSTTFTCCPGGSSPTGTGPVTSNANCKCSAGQSWNGTSCI